MHGSLPSSLFYSMVIAKASRSAKAKIICKPPTKDIFSRKLCYVTLLISNKILYTEKSQERNDNRKCH